METEAVEGLQKFSQQSGLGELIEQWGYWFVIGLALLFVRESISNIISGAMIFFGSSYTNNECVWGIFFDTLPNLFHNPRINANANLFGS